MDAPAVRTCCDPGLVELGGGVSMLAKVLKDQPMVAGDVAHAEGADCLLLDALARDAFKDGGGDL
jgi:hypothetical protein